MWKAALYCITSNNHVTLYYYALVEGSSITSPTDHAPNLSGLLVDIEGLLGHMCTVGVYIRGTGTGQL